MKPFLKTTLACGTGFIVAALVLFLISLLTINTLTTKDRTYKLKDNSVLTIELKGEISEQATEMPFDFSIPGTPLSSQTANQGLDKLLEAIHRAKELDQIKGIYLESGVLSTGFVTCEEIREALKDFKRSGKFVLAYGDLYDQREYYICSVADKVLLNPQGMFNWAGLASTPVFYADALKKIGLHVEVFKVGLYKSAVEPYINTHMSEPSRRQTTEYLHGIWNHLVNQVAADRHLAVKHLNEMANENLLFADSRKVLKEGLVDSLVYEQDVKKWLAGRIGVNKPEDLHMVSVSQLITVPKKQTTYLKDKIAVLYAEGQIYDEEGDGIRAKEFVKEIEKIGKDTHIKAVVLRVNSPGGSMFGSEQIWEALNEVKQSKPIVVSMGDVAASGGYYISCLANKIVAAPSTITGSIGIFGLFVTTEELTGKLGINFDVVKTHNLSDMGHIGRPMAPIEKQKIQAYIERGYDHFIQRCADGRHMKADSVKKVAEGRVWTGEDALKAGLVDTLGGIREAISIAAHLAKTSQYRLVYYPEKQNFISYMMERFFQDASLKIASRYMGKDYEPYLRLKRNGLQTGVLALMEPININ